MFTVEQIADALERVWGELTSEERQLLIDTLHVNNSFPMSEEMVKIKFGTETFARLES